MFDVLLYFWHYSGKTTKAIYVKGANRMSFVFPDKSKENKAQWHFSKEKARPGYDSDDDGIITDVLGSYTGTPYDDLRPVQDADDL